MSTVSSHEMLRRGLLQFAIGMFLLRIVLVVGLMATEVFLFRFSAFAAVNLSLQVVWWPAALAVLFLFMLRQEAFGQGDWRSLSTAFIILALFFLWTGFQSWREIRAIMPGALYLIPAAVAAAHAYGMRAGFQAPALLRALVGIVLVAGVLYLAWPAWGMPSLTFSYVWRMVAAVSFMLAVLVPLCLLELTLRSGASAAPFRG